MDLTELPPSPVSDLRTIEITAEHEALLQRFLDANPDYHTFCYGEPPAADEAHKEIHEALPAGWSYTKKWLIGYVDKTGELAAFANVVTDLLAPNVWHIGYFYMATARHGSGLAQELYGGLERWAFANGAEWLRLGVVVGNARGERFWEACGFLESRRRTGPYGKLTQTNRVMFKPLAGGTLEEYRALVPRDHPDAP